MRIVQRSFFILTLLLIGICFLGGCNRKATIKNGREAYYAKQFAVSAKLLKNEYRASKKRKDKAILAFFAGESLLRIKQPVEAAKWFYKSYKNGYGDLALAKYADCLVRQERYKEAREIYQNLQKQSKNTYAFDRQILQTKYAEIVKSRFVDSLFEQSTLWATDYNEYGTFLLRDGQMLFTSDRPEGRKVKIYGWTGRPFTNIYVAPTNPRSAQSPTLWLPITQSSDNDGTPTLNSKENFVVYTSCFDEEEDNGDATCKLLVTTLSDGVWSEPEILPFVDGRYNYTTPAWNEKEQALYFSSNLPGGQGGYDLYLVRRKDNRWGGPVNLGSRINSAFDELYPTFDGDTLLFSSDGHGGMGGMDLFKSYLKSDGKWSAPVNMGYPWNSGGDELCAIRDTSVTDTTALQAFYLSSTRRNEGSGFDLYHITQFKPRKPKLADTVLTPATKTILYLAITTLRTDKEHSDRTLPLANVGIKINGTQYFTDRKGLFVLPLKDHSPLSILLTKKGYFTQRTSFRIPDSTVYQGKTSYTFQKRILMKPIIENQEIVLKDIHYDFDKWDIRADARPTLDSLFTLLRLNPKLHIQLAAHTDCKGEEDYNMQLSQKRAASVVQYLIGKGINPKRLSAKGYGETQPLIQCECERCTDAQRQKNRRTTFKVLRQ